MIAAKPLASELEEALKKVANRQPLTRVEHELVQRALDSTPLEPERDDELRGATARLRAKGIDDEVVFTGNADEAIAFLDATER